MNKHTKNLQDYINEGNITELSILYDNSHDDDEIRDTIRDNISRIAEANGIDSFVYSTWEELRSYYEDTRSPLRDLAINNGYILVTDNDKIPYTQEEFFCLLEKTTLDGVRVLFSVKDNRIVTKEELTIANFDDGVVVENYIPNGETISLETEDVVELDHEEVSDYRPINHLFDPNYKGTDRLISDGFIIYTRAHEETSLLDLILDMYERNAKGFVLFDGLDKWANYKMDKSMEKGWPSSVTLPYHICYFEEDYLVNETREVVFSNDTIEDNEILRMIGQFPHIEESYSQELKLSLIAFCLTSSPSYTDNVGSELYLNGYDYDPFGLAKDPIVYDLEDEGSIAYEGQNGVTLLISDRRKLLGQEITLSNDKNYIIGDQVTEGFVYELTEM